MRAIRRITGTIVLTGALPDLGSAALALTEIATSGSSQEDSDGRA